jgi:hypothetical protein
MQAKILISYVSLFFSTFKKGYENIFNIFTYHIYVKNMKIFSSVNKFTLFFLLSHIFLLHIRFIFASKNFFRFFAKQTLFSLFRFIFFRFRFASYRFKRKFGDTLVTECSVADPGSGSILPQGSGIRYEFFPDSG